MTCPECEAQIDLEEDELGEGDVITCEECGVELKVLGLDPLELELVDEEDEDEGPDADEEDEQERWR